MQAHYEKREEWSDESISSAWNKYRDVAQSGSVLAWGARGRGFESRHPDNKGSSEPKSLQILRFAGFFIFYVSVRFRQFQQK